MAKVCSALGKCREKAHGAPRDAASKRGYQEASQENIHRHDAAGFGLVHVVKFFKLKMFRAVCNLGALINLDALLWMCKFCWKRCALN